MESVGCDDQLAFQTRDPGLEIVDSRCSVQNECDTSRQQNERHGHVDAFRDFFEIATLNIKFAFSVFLILVLHGVIQAIVKTNTGGYTYKERLLSGSVRIQYTMSALFVGVLLVASAAVSAEFSTVYGSVPAMFYIHHPDQNIRRYDVLNKTVTSAMDIPHTFDEFNTMTRPRNWRMVALTQDLATAVVMPRDPAAREALGLTKAVYNCFALTANPFTRRYSICITTRLRPDELFASPQLDKLPRWRVQEGIA